MAVSQRKIDKWAKKKKIAKLHKALSDKDPQIRVAVVEAFGTIDHDDARNNIIAALRDPEPIVRAAAVTALAKIGNDRVLEFVRKVSIDDTDETVRAKATNAYATLKARIAELEKATYN